MSSGPLLAVDVPTGELRWSLPLADGRYWSSLLGAHGDVVVLAEDHHPDSEVGSDDGERLLGVDALTGEVRWSRAIDGEAWDVRVLGDLVLVPAGAEIHAIDTSTGGPRWRTRGGQRTVLSRPARFDGSAVVSVVVVAQRPQPPGEPWRGGSVPGATG